MQTKLRLLLSVLFFQACLSQFLEICDSSRKPSGDTQSRLILSGLVVIDFATEIKENVFTLMSREIKSMAKKNLFMSKKNAFDLTC